MALFLYLGVAMAFNIFGEDNGRYEEYKFCDRMGGYYLFYLLQDCSQQYMR